MGDIGIGEVFSMTRNRLIAVEQPEISTALVDTVQLENAARNGQRSALRWIAPAMPPPP